MSPVPSCTLLALIETRLTTRHLRPPPPFWRDHDALAGMGGYLPHYFGLTRFRCVFDRLFLLVFWRQIAVFQVSEGYRKEEEVAGNLSCLF